MGKRITAHFTPRRLNLLVARLFVRIVVLMIAASSLACANLFKAPEPAFTLSEGERTHKTSGIRVPASIPGWTEESLDENVSPEIFASVNFEKELLENPDKPRGKIYLMKAKSTQNLKIVENRILTEQTGLKLLKSDAVRMKNKKQILMSSYVQDVRTSGTGGGGVTVYKNSRRQYDVATTLKDSQLVVLSVFNPDVARERDQAMDFIQKSLFSQAVKIQKN